VFTPESIDRKDHPMSTRTRILFTVGSLAALALLAAAPNPGGGTAATLTWTQSITQNMPEIGHQLTWDEAVIAAAAYTGQGTDGLTHDDWRLPTEKELQNALKDGSWGVGDPNVTWGGWTSKGTGIWAYAVYVTTDANGNVIPSQSGQSSKTLKTSQFANTKFVRP
jgi:hypothetical protein